MKKKKAFDFNYKSLSWTNIKVIINMGKYYDFQFKNCLKKGFYVKKKKRKKGDDSKYEILKIFFMLWK